MARGVTIRLSTEDDRSAIGRLAQLDGKRLPMGPTLLAESSGDLRAALQIETGAAVADPFHLTADLVSLLQLRAAQIRGGGRRGTGIRIPARRGGARAVAARAVRA
jgi:hypothetical protein